MKSDLKANSQFKILIPKIYAFGGLAVIVYIFLSYMLSVKFIQDDAYTTLHYAKNFIEGKGLVFNEGEHVEGFTNLLWVMILSAVGFTANVLRITVQLQNVAQFLSIFFGVTVLIVTYFLSRRINYSGDDEPLPSRLLNETINLIPVFLIAYSTPLIYWSVSGMETSLFVTLTLLSLLFYLKSLDEEKFSKTFVAAAVLDTLVRPEGMFFFSIIVLHEFVHNLMTKNDTHFLTKFKKSFSKRIIREIIYYAIPILVLTVFRLIYYGYPLPNTFYAKTEFTLQFLERGINYFWGFASPYLLYGVLLIVPFILLLIRKNRKEVLLYYLIVISWLAVVIILGGDVLPINRFFLPIMSLIFILAIKSFHFLIEKFLSQFETMQYSTTLLLLAISVEWGIQVFRSEEPVMLEKRSYEVGLVTKMKIYADWVNHQSEIQKRKLSVAMSTIGAFSYFSNSRVIDLIGLADSYIAHHPKETPGITNELPLLWKERHYNADYVLSLKPDYIIFPAGAKPSAFAECAVFVHSEFQKLYYTQIFYSERLNLLLPIFTRSNADGKNDEAQPCSIKFLKHFILAYNYFIDLTNTGNSSLLKLVIAQCDNVPSLCPEKLADALTIKGLAFYHVGMMNEAQNYLTKAAEMDPANSIARFYLKNIYAQEGKKVEAAKMILEIEKYSPDAFPNIVLTQSKNFLENSLQER